MRRSIPAATTRMRDMTTKNLHVRRVSESECVILSLIPSGKRATRSQSYARAREDLSAFATLDPGLRYLRQ